MVTESRVPPLRWVLPFAQLLFCVGILWPMRAMFINEGRASLRAYGIVHELPGKERPGPQRVIPFDFSDPDVQRRLKRSQTREWIVATLNLPAGLPDLPCAMEGSDHGE